jgi:hypothetical protein
MTENFCRSFSMSAGALSALSSVVEIVGMMNAAPTFDWFAWQHRGEAGDGEVCATPGS